MGSTSIEYKYNCTQIGISEKGVLRDRHRMR